MFKPDIEFYSPTNIKTYNLDQAMRYQLNMLENLDIITRRHSENVANLTCRMCEYLHAKKLFTIHATICAYLHDIGKLFIPLEILNKPSQLTSEEFEVMKTHTTIGYNICMKDLKLRPYAGGALYHHECLDGSGYPNGITKDEIPAYAQIIHIADVYDALVTKRQYTTHIDISETLKLLLKDTEPSVQSLALDALSTQSKYGKINMKFLKVLFKVVIDDILYEISCTQQYLKYLEEQIKRLNKVEKYINKSNTTVKENDKEYFLECAKLLFTQGENLENYKQIILEYEEALKNRKNIIDRLYNEIDIIKKLEKQ